MRRGKTLGAFQMPFGILFRDWAGFGRLALELGLEPRKPKNLLWMSAYEDNGVGKLCCARPPLCAKFSVINTPLQL